MPASARTGGGYSRLLFCLATFLVVVISPAVATPSWWTPGWIMYAVFHYFWCRTKPFMLRLLFLLSRCKAPLLSRSGPRVCFHCTLRVTQDCVNHFITSHVLCDNFPLHMRAWVGSSQSVDLVESQAPPSRDNISPSLIWLHPYCNYASNVFICCVHLVVTIINQPTSTFN